MPRLSDQWCAGRPGELPAPAENLPHMSILAQTIAPSAITACSLNLDLLNVFRSAAVVHQNISSTLIWSIWKRLLFLLVFCQSSRTLKVVFKLNLSSWHQSPPKCLRFIFVWTCEPRLHRQPWQVITSYSLEPIMQHNYFRRLWRKHLCHYVHTDQPLIESASSYSLETSSGVCLRHVSFFHQCIVLKDVFQL